MLLSAAQARLFDLLLLGFAVLLLLTALFGLISLARRLTARVVVFLAQVHAAPAGNRGDTYQAG